MCSSVGFYFSSRRRHTRCALVTGVQTCALPISYDRLELVKGPQTVLWGPGASAGTVRFDRDTPRFEQPGARVRGSVLGGNAGRNDQVLDATVGATAGYARLSANRSEAGDYASGNGTRVPSAWKKWNGDLALGWTPDADTLVELTAGAGDGVARYAGRSMDGAQFRRDSLGLRAERAFDGVLRKLEANVYQNVADHVRSEEHTSELQSLMRISSAVFCLKK